MRISTKPPHLFLELCQLKLKKKTTKKNDLPRKKKKKKKGAHHIQQRDLPGCTRFHHNKQAAHNITSSIDTEQERHESIIKRGMWFFFFLLRRNNILNILAPPSSMFEVNVTTEGDAFTGGVRATISQHFSLPPPEFADFYLTTFAHSHPFFFCLLSTVAETVSHFKGCESSFQKTLPPFNLSDAP